MSFYVGNTRVVITFSFLLVTTLLLLLDSQGIGWILLLSIALHESAHLAAMRLFGIPLAEIGLYPFGVQIRRGGSQVSYGRDAVVYLAGCFGSLLVGALTFEVNSLLSAVNIALGLFNLLPVPPLDGGQALGAICRRRLSEHQARRILPALSAAVLVPLACAAVFLLRCGGNFSLMITLLFLVGGLARNR